MEIRSGEKDVAQAGRFERCRVGVLASHMKAAEHEKIRTDGRLIDCGQIVLLNQALRFLRERRNVVPEDSDANVVKAEIGEEFDVFDT